MANGASFDYPMKGPFGMCLQNQLNQTFNENVAFSESSWENAKQNCQYGCVLPPGIPQWPPGVTPLSAPAQFASAAAGAGTMTDAQVINTLQAKPFQFDSPYVVKNEYQRFVPNNSPAVRRSLENGCGSTLPTQIIANANQVAASTLANGSQPQQAMNGNMISTFFRSLVEAVKGLNYDVKNWAQLPGETTGQKLKFLVSHDSDRGLVIGLGVLVLAAVIVFIVLMCVIGCCRGCA